MTSDDREFRPDDPDTVVVHYDLDGWDADQIAALTESLANEGLPHAWRGTELLVPESDEEAVDTVFDRLEDELGPFPVMLAAGEPGTEFQLDDWAPAEIDLLRRSLVEAEIPHRWEGDNVVVAEDAEDTVDDLLDAIEAGDLAPTEAAETAPDGVLQELFAIGDRLARDGTASAARTQLFDLLPTLSPEAAPFGVALGVWRRVLERATDVRAAFTAADFEPARVSSAAEDLRDVCRPWV